jgi:hypothetical protein
MTHTNVLVELEQLKQTYNIDEETSGPTGLLIKLVQEASDPQEACRLLGGLKGTLMGTINVSVLGGEVILRRPYDG